MLIDTHCHLEKNEYKNLEELIAKIFKSDIDKIIINGYDVASNQEALDSAEKYKNVYAAVGFHPEMVNEIKEQDYKILEKQILHKKVVAVGEIGLDYYRMNDNKEKQQKMFIKQLKLAKKYNKPVIIHNRDATSDLCRILTKIKAKGILHCFNDSLEMANKFIKMGFLLGIGGMVTFKNNPELKTVIKEIPLEYIVLETDSPYLAPEPFRGKQNTPLYLKYIAKEIAKIKNVTYEKVADITTKNVSRLFDF